MNRSTPTQCNYGLLNAGGGVVTDNCRPHTVSCFVGHQTNFLRRLKFISQWTLIFKALELLHRPDQARLTGRTPAEGQQTKPYDTTTPVWH